METRMRFKKAPGWIGKRLTIYINGGDRTIGDTEVLVGQGFEKFVPMGWLVRIPDPIQTPRGPEVPPEPPAKVEEAEIVAPVVPVLPELEDVIPEPMLPKEGVPKPPVDSNIYPGGGGVSKSMVMEDVQVRSSRKRRRA
jgi:hypothetical protein